jgi:antitoxin CptB
LSEESRDNRIKRLSMRSMRRGIKEMDVILTRYAAIRLDAMDETALDHYDALLVENDQDLYQWVTGQVDPPVQHVGLVADIASVALTPK